MSDDNLKSAFELAMERLRQTDATEGTAPQALSDDQKAAIAEARNFYGARLAQQDVLHRSTLSRTFDPAERASLEDDYRRERERIIAERDAKIERLRRGGSS
jgi:hypothetical protein